MKRITSLAVLLIAGISLQVSAKQVYKVQVKIPDVKDSMVFLAHYYGKPLPTIYKRDSARFDRNGVATFTSTDSTFVGGIYMMLLSDKKTYFELLLNKGDDIGINVTLSKLPDGVKFKNSPENERFQAYVDFLKTYSAGQEALKKELSEATTAADTAKVRKKAGATSKDLINYRADYAKKYPNSLLAN
ncbi:MAG: DUF4369 domain-containing protein, partial [Chitinophagia bacterium]|nr:DUF4369 domain-containing protein [Chitinophagia bacterium]